MDADNKNKFYLVSFGDSDRYIIRDDASSEASRLARVESELNDFLRAKFPDETFAYYTTPKVEEVAEENVAQYEGYPELDDKAIDAIKKVLEREVADMEAQKALNDNSPFANVNPAAADIPNILG